MSTHVLKGLMLDAGIIYKRTVKCLYTEQICVVVDGTSGQTKKDNSVSLVFLISKVDGIKGNQSVFIFSCFVILFTYFQLLYDMIRLACRISGFEPWL